MTMKKAEALKAMCKGEKVTHRYFSSNEWMTIENGKILFEDGVRCNQEDFFNYRQKAGWEDGYSLFNKALNAEVSDTTGDHQSN